MATVLRNMKVPERMTGSRALRAYLLAHSEHGQDVSRSPEQLKQLNGVLLISHLEIITRSGHWKSASPSRSTTTSRRN